QKIRAMNYAQLAAAIGGGILPALTGEKKADDKKPEDKKTAERKSDEEVLSLIPPAGFKIPDRYKDGLSPFDKDKDGRLDRAEVEAMPAPVRGKVLDGIRDRIEKKQEKESAKP